MMLISRIARGKTEKDLKLSRDKFINILRKEKDLRIELNDKLVDRQAYSYRSPRNDEIEKFRQKELLELGLNLEDYYDSWDFYIENDYLCKEINDILNSMIS
jgi:hypothetical protein